MAEPERTVILSASVSRTELGPTARVLDPAETRYKENLAINPLNAELNPICHLLVLLGDLTLMSTCIVSIFQYTCTSNKMQRYTVYLYCIWKLLNMFRVVLPPIIRSAYNYIYSIWYMSHRYCYLPLSWKSWNRFECAVGDVRHPQHTQTCAVSSITLNIKTLLDAPLSKQLRRTVDMCTFRECKKRNLQYLSNSLDIF
jgi:hypothetical protein